MSERQGLPSKPAPVSHSGSVDTGQTAAGSLPSAHTKVAQIAIVSMTTDGSPLPPKEKAACMMDSRLWKTFAGQRLAWWDEEARGHRALIVFPGPGSLSSVF